MKFFLRSKKTKGLLIGLAAMIGAATLTKWGLSEDTANELMQWIAGIVSAYLLGQGYADGQSQGATSSSAVDYEL